MSEHKNILNTVNTYYTGKIKNHGPTPQGVDWNGEESQFMRFEQLTKNAVSEKNKVSILDYGCGFGSLIKFLESKKLNFDYTGFDISDSMLEESAKVFPDKKYKWTNKIDSQSKFDYVFLSGIFNVKLEISESEWIEYVKESLALINSITKKEFSFNMLTSYSDKEYMKDYLYYAKPEYWFGHCKTNVSKKVVMNHDYPLYEFTIHVIK